MFANREERANPSHFHVGLPPESAPPSHTDAIESFHGTPRTPPPLSHISSCGRDSSGEETLTRTCASLARLSLLDNTIFQGLWSDEDAESREGQVRWIRHGQTIVWSPPADLVMAISAGKDAAEARTTAGCHAWRRVEVETDPKSFASDQGCASCAVRSHWMIVAIGWCVSWACSFWTLHDLGVMRSYSLVGSCTHLGQSLIAGGFTGGQSAGMKHLLVKKLTSSILASFNVIFGARQNH